MRSKLQSAIATGVPTPTGENEKILIEISHAVSSYKLVINGTRTCGGSLCVLFSHSLCEKLKKNRRQLLFVSQRPEKKKVNNFILNSVFVL